MNFKSLLKSFLIISLSLVFTNSNGIGIVLPSLADQIDNNQAIAADINLFFETSDTNGTPTYFPSYSYISMTDSLVPSLARSFLINTIPNVANVYQAASTQEKSVIKLAMQTFTELVQEYNGVDTTSAQLVNGYIVGLAKVQNFQQFSSWITTTTQSIVQNKLSSNLGFINNMQYSNVASQILTKYNATSNSVVQTNLLNSLLSSLQSKIAASVAFGNSLTTIANAVAANDNLPNLSAVIYQQLNPNATMAEAQNYVYIQTTPGMNLLNANAQTAFASMMTTLPPPNNIANTFPTTSRLFATALANAVGNQALKSNASELMPILSDLALNLSTHYEQTNLPQQLAQNIATIPNLLQAATSFASAQRGLMNVAYPETQVLDDTTQASFVNMYMQASNNANFAVLKQLDNIFTTIYGQFPTKFSGLQTSLSSVTNKILTAYKSNTISSYDKSILTNLNTNNLTYTQVQHQLNLAMYPQINLLSPTTTQEAFMAVYNAQKSSATQPATQLMKILNHLYQNTSFSSSEQQSFAIYLNQLANNLSNPKASSATASMINTLYDDLDLTENNIVDHSFSEVTTYFKSAVYPFLNLLPSSFASTVLDTAPSNAVMNDLLTKIGPALYNAYSQNPSSDSDFKQQFIALAGYLYTQQTNTKMLTNLDAIAATASASSLSSDIDKLIQAAVPASMSQYLQTTTYTDLAKLYGTNAANKTSNVAVQNFIATLQGISPISSQASTWTSQLNQIAELLVNSPNATLPASVKDELDNLYQASQVKNQTASVITSSIQDTLYSIQNPNANPSNVGASVFLQNNAAGMKLLSSSAQAKLSNLVSANNSVATSYVTALTALAESTSVTATDKTQMQTTLNNIVNLIQRNIAVNPSVITDALSSQTNKSVSAEPSSTSILSAVNQSVNTNAAILGSAAQTTYINLLANSNGQTLESTKDLSNVLEYLNSAYVTSETAPAMQAAMRALVSKALQTIQANSQYNYVPAGIYAALAALAQTPEDKLSYASIALPLAKYYNPEFSLIPSDTLPAFVADYYAAPQLQSFKPMQQFLSVLNVINTDYELTAANKASYAPQISYFINQFIAYAANPATMPQSIQNGISSLYNELGVTEGGQPYPFQSGTVSYYLQQAQYPYSNVLTSDQQMQFFKMAESDSDKTVITAFGNVLQTIDTKYKGSIPYNIQTLMSTFNEDLASYKGDYPANIITAIDNLNTVVNKSSFQTQDLAVAIAQVIYPFINVLPATQQSNFAELYSDIKLAGANTNVADGLTTEQTSNVTAMANLLQTLQKNSAAENMNQNTYITPAEAQVYTSVVGSLVNQMYNDDAPTSINTSTLTSLISDMQTAASSGTLASIVPKVKFFISNPGVSLLTSSQQTQLYNLLVQNPKNANLNYFVTSALPVLQKLVNNINVSQINAKQSLITDVQNTAAYILTYGVKDTNAILLSGIITMTAQASSVLTQLTGVNTYTATQETQLQTNLQTIVAMPVTAANPISMTGFNTQDATQLISLYNTLLPNGGSATGTESNLTVVSNIVQTIKTIYNTPYLSSTQKSSLMSSMETLVNRVITSYNNTKELPPAINGLTFGDYMHDLYHQVELFNNINPVNWSTTVTNKTGYPKLNAMITQIVNQLPPRTNPQPIAPIISTVSPVTIPALGITAADITATKGSSDVTYTPPPQPAVAPFIPPQIW